MSAGKPLAPFGRSRRALLLAPFALPLPAFAAEYPPVRSGVPLHFPRDHGAHPAFRTEWWYLTGWLRDTAGHESGVQITFFRNRPGLQELNPSRFAPTQLLFAHAALADAARGRLLHDQRAARAGFDLAQAGEATTDVHVGDWSLRLEGTRYRARIDAREFRFDLMFDAAEPPLLQGDRGYSRKGPKPAQASYYYSRPQLTVTGTVTSTAAPVPVSGRAWLDHEWSSEYLASDAVGWDWVGLNLDHGGALMVFRMRDAAGRTVWAGGTRRDAAGNIATLDATDVGFEPLRWWRSPRSGAAWPVAMRIRAGSLVLEVQPLMDDQELDSRASVGTIYWEGAVRILIAGGYAGRGYLELTGYWRPMKL